MNIQATKIYQVDAFTTEAFKGNPAGVMLLDHLEDPEWMQNMAMEMHLSETAFVQQSGNEFDIRYFTPTSEIPLAGHPTLASAHIIYELGIVPVTKNITLNAKGGKLTVSKNEDNLSMELPAYSLEQIETPVMFEELVGFEPLTFYKSDYNWKIAVAKNEQDITEAQPQFEKLVKYGLGHLMITASSLNAENDFVVRCFAPSLGVNEDPVTGSAHCALTPLWANILNKTRLHSLQLSKRTGRLQLELLNNKVKVTGQAITIFEATLKIITPNRI